MDPLGALEAVEAGCGEDKSVTLSGGELFEAGVDVATDVDELDVGTEGEKLSAATGAGGADAASHGECVEGPVGLANPDVAGVGSFGDSCEGELRRELGGEIFEGVDGEVDAAFFEGFLDLLDRKSVV